MPVCVIFVWYREGRCVSFDIGLDDLNCKAEIYWNGEKEEYEQDICPWLHSALKFLENYIFFKKKKL